MKINGVGPVEFIDELRPRWQVPGIAVGIYCQGEEQFFFSGTRDIDHDLPITAETVMPLGSVTKPFLAHAASLIARENLFNWHVPLSDYVRDFHFNAPEIESKANMIDLLSMRTGLDGNEEYSPLFDWTHFELKALAKNLVPKGAFRETFIYSSFSVALATVAVEEVSRKSWTEILEQEFQSEGLDSYAFSWKQAQEKRITSRGYLWTGASHEEAQWPEGEEEVIATGGSLCLSPKDLLKWLRAEMECSENEILFEPYVYTRYPDVPLDFWPESYGLCWGLRSYRGHKMVYHRGSDHGFRSVVAMIPENQTAIAVQSNLGGNLLIHLVLNHLLDALLGHSFIP